MTISQGHETTSGMSRFSVQEYPSRNTEFVSGTLSFATYYLIKNPATMRRLREEVDEVLGGEPPQHSDLSKLKYLNGKA